MHHQFNIQQLCALHTLCVFVLYYLGTNSDLCNLQHKLIGFYNRDEKCLLRGVYWVFKLSSPCFIFKGLITGFILNVLYTILGTSVCEVLCAVKLPFAHCRSKL